MVMTRAERSDAASTIERPARDCKRERLQRDTGSFKTPLEAADNVARALLSLCGPTSSTGPTSLLRISVAYPRSHRLVPHRAVVAVDAGAVGDVAAGTGASRARVRPRHAARAAHRRKHAARRRSFVRILQRSLGVRRSTMDRAPRLGGPDLWDRARLRRSARQDGLVGWIR